MTPRDHIAILEKASLLAQIRDHGPISRADLGRYLQLRPSTVTELVRSLIEDGLVKELGAGNPSGGRPPVLLGIDYESNYAISLILEVNGLSGALVRWDGKIECRLSKDISHDSDLSTLTTALTEICDNLLSLVPRQRIHGIGMGISALVNPSENEVIFSSTIAAAQQLRLNDLSQKYQIPVYLEDVAYMVALGERWFVYPKDTRPLVLIYVSGGMCGAILEPWAKPGIRPFAAEFGHMQVRNGGPLCGCGKRGCLEACVSEKALLASAQRLLAQPQQEKITLDDVKQMAKSGNHLAQELIAATANYLGTAVANLVNIFAPALIILSGSVVESFNDLLFPILQREVKGSAIEQLLDEVEILPSTLGRDAALYGGAARVMQSVFTVPTIDLLRKSEHFEVAVAQ